jgi:hypothetical protein
MASEHYVLNLRVDKITSRTTADGSTSQRRTSGQTVIERKSVAELTSVILRGDSLEQILLKAEKLIQLERDMGTASAIRGDHMDFEEEDDE